MAVDLRLLTGGDVFGETTGTPVFPTLSRTRPCPYFALYQSRPRVAVRMAAQRSARRRISLEIAAGPKLTPW